VLAERRRGGRRVDTNRLERLPPPLADGRSLGGAIKIFFQKVVSRLLGLDFPYPVLAAATVGAGGEVQVEADADRVRKRLEQAKRVALFVHGIIGDTRSMVPAVRLAKAAGSRPLAELYDVVLSFDYENLNTTIEDNARALKRRLEEVGLGAGYGKRLDVVAHSMGGLVSRWFIEREGGNKVVSRLVMLGTPNAGSPWPTVVDWATLAIGLGLNQLTAIPWAASVLGQLTGLLDSAKVALAEMNSQSALLKGLSESPDPGVPYTMLAGNTSLIPAATAGGQEKSRLARLLARLASPALLHQAANPFFFGQPNDIAVSVASMESVAAGRVPKYEVRPVACDHLSYFRDEAGLRALAEALGAG
jgi:pimeloyl-ACP methyl ester carboxylesterase